MVGRARWLTCGGLLLAAGVLTVLATTDHWARCRPALDIADCLSLEQATTGAPSWGPVAFRDPTAVLLTVLAGFLLCGAWVLVAGWARGQWMRTVVSVVIALQPLSGSVLGLVDFVSPDVALRVAQSGWLTWPAEMLVLPLLLGAGWILEEGPLETTRLIVLGWGVTSFGSMHTFGDYMIFMARHQGPVPPPGHRWNPDGLGFGIACTQLGVGLVVVVLTLLVRRHRGPGRNDERFGRDGLTLAA